MIDYNKLKEEHARVSEQLSQADVLGNREKYQQVTRRFSFLEKIVAILKTRDECLAQKAHLKEVLTAPKEEEEVKLMAREELAAVERKIIAFEEDIEDRLFEEDEPEGDVLVEIRAAAGGEESALFAASLLKMYSKYAEKKSWNLEVLSSHATDIKGYKEVIFSVQGTGAYSNFKFESGVHRVQRVPETEASGRVHTSTVTVAVLIEPKEVELKLGPEDLKIDTYRAGGAGGQHVNRTDSAVRMTHIPTGIVVCCQDERSQLKNRTKALKVMKMRIMDKMEREQTAKVTNARRVQVGTGERSEKIRTYNFPERRITDHRINFTSYRLEAVLEGDLDELIKILIHEERKKIYELKGLA